jgi:hypothetical protein
MACHFKFSRSINSFKEGIGEERHAVSLTDIVICSKVSWSMIIRISGDGFEFPLPVGFRKFNGCR